jgi:hypothetical protein
MAETVAVFLSSSLLALPEHAQEVRKACWQLRLLPLLIEHLPAGAEAVPAVLELVDQADVYLGVFAHRYHDPKRALGSTSLAEIEYDRAVARDIPRLIFLIHPDHPVRAADVDGGLAAEGLRAFKRRLENERELRYFRSTDDLQAQVLLGLTSFLRQGPAPMHPGGRGDPRPPHGGPDTADGFYLVAGQVEELVKDNEPLLDTARKVRAIASLAPEAAMVLIRKMLSYVAIAIYDRHVGPAGTQPLENLLRKLVSEQLLPEREAAFASTVKDLGNVGAHHFTPVTFEDVHHSFNGLQRILTWFVKQYKQPTTAGPGAPAAETGPKGKRQKKPAEAGRGAAKPPPTPPEPAADSSRLEAAYLLSYSEDGQTWRGLGPQAQLPKGSFVRAMIRSEGPCHALLLIEALDPDGRTADLHVFGPGDADPCLARAEATTVRPDGVWYLLPPGQVLLERQSEKTAAWRIGLLLQVPPPESLLAILASFPRPVAASANRTDEMRAAMEKWLTEVRAALPTGEGAEGQLVPVTEETEVGYGLDPEAKALVLRGPGPLLHWSEVRFQ